MIEKVASQQGEMLAAHQSESRTRHGQVSFNVGALGQEMNTQRHRQESYALSIHQEISIAKQKYDELKSKYGQLEKEKGK